MNSWFVAGAAEDRDSHRDRAKQKQGPTHHQGSSSLSGYQKRWVRTLSTFDAFIVFRLDYVKFLLIIFLSSSQSSSHGGRTLSKFQAYGMARKAKASSDVTFNVDDPPEAYSDPGIHARITTYASEVRSVRSDWDPSTDDIDGTVVMRVGQGKKHGRYWLGDGVLDSTQDPSLSQIRAETPSGGPAIRQRSSPSQQKIVALEVSPVALVVH